MARALLIGKDEEAAIAALREKAAAAPIAQDVLQFRAFRASSGEFVEPFPEFTIQIPQGYTVSYTVELQPPGPCRHMSVSIDSKKLPHIEAVKLLMKEFRFINPIENVFIIESIMGDGRKSINVIEPLDGNLTPFLQQPDRPASPRVLH